MAKLNFFELTPKEINEILTVEMVNQYYEDIMRALFGRRSLFGIFLTIDPKSKLNELCENKILFQKCLESSKDINLLVGFSSELLTEEVIEQYSDKILDYLDKHGSYGGDVFYESKILFQKCLERKMYLLLQFFSPETSTEKVIAQYSDEIIDYLSEGHVLPAVLRQSKILFQKCLEQKKINLLLQFSEDVFTEEVINQYGLYIIEYLKFNSIPLNLKENNFIRNLFINVKRKDLLFQMLIPFDILNDLEELSEYASILEISVEELSNKIKYLYDRNDEIFTTLLVGMLSKKMSVFNIETIERMAIYDDIQGRLLKCDDKFLTIVARIVNCFNDDSYDISSIIYMLLINKAYYRQLLDSIDLQCLNDEMINNLVTIMMKRKNYYNIRDMSELTDKSMSKIKLLKNEEVMKKISDNSITVEELRDAVLEKKFGLDIESALFICERYCSDLKSLEKSSISDDTKKILFSIKGIVDCNSIDKLKYLYLSSSTVEYDFYSGIALEVKIRSEFAKLYSDSLYRVNEEHRMVKGKNVSSTVFDTLNAVEYKNKKPSFYIVDGDFNMQIHVLGAYRKWTRPEDFKEDWLRPKIAYHGICTSYIGNNQIANARQYHPTYGFSSYESSALLLAGNYDLFSDGSIAKYATSFNRPYNFYDPRIMIDKTRHSHNEMVLERRNNVDGKSFKRVPDYVVYFTNDIENISKEIDTELFKETIQAAIDNDIPIVIVDRLKYAKSERDKITNKVNEFMINPTAETLEFIITQYCNNMIGCKYYETQEKAEYHTIFTKEKLLNVVSTLYDFINTLNMSKRNELLMVLESLLKNENISFEIPKDFVYNENTKKNGK